MKFGYLQKEKNKFVKVKILGQKTYHGLTYTYGYYLIELPDKTKKEVSVNELFT